MFFSQKKSKGAVVLIFLRSGKTPGLLDVESGMNLQHEPVFLNDFCFDCLLSHDYGRVDLIVLQKISCFSYKKIKTDRNPTLGRNRFG